MKRIPIIIISVIVILALTGTVTWLFVSGKLVWAGSSMQTSSTKIVCGEDLINKYNNSMFYMLRGNDTTTSLDVEGIKNVKAEILTKDGYKTEPSCQSMLLLIALYEADYDGAKAAFEAVNALHEKNIFADSNIRGNLTSDLASDAVYTLSPEYKLQPEPKSE